MSSLPHENDILLFFAGTNGFKLKLKNPTQINHEKAQTKKHLSTSKNHM